MSAFSSTTARPWPTPMQIAATPQRWPPSLHHLGERAEDPAARGAERVPDRDRAAAGVHDLRVDLPGVEADQRLHGEGLVELDGADVGPADAGPGQRLLGRLDRGVAEPVRLERVGAAAGDARDGERPRASAAPSEPSSTAEAPSLSGEALPAVMVPSLRNDGLELRQRLDARPGPDRLVAGDVGVGHGDHEVVVEAVAPGPVGELVRAGGERVLALAGDAVLLLELLVGLAERDRPLLRHARVDQPPAERGGDRLEVAGGEARERAWAAPRAPGSSTRRRRSARCRRRRSRSSGSRPWRRRARSRRAG